LVKLLVCNMKFLFIENEILIDIIIIFVELTMMILALFIIFIMYKLGHNIDSIIFKYCCLRLLNRFKIEIFI
jgi:hypothetical protein